jgi:hypothetical protein
MDGGVIDTTGIIGLLKQQKDHISEFIPALKYPWL